MRLCLFLGRSDWWTCTVTITLFGDLLVRKSVTLKCENHAHNCVPWIISILVQLRFWCYYYFISVRVFLGSGLKLMSQVTWAQRYLLFGICTLRRRGSDSEHWRSNQKFNILDNLPCIAICINILKPYPTATKDLDGQSKWASKYGERSLLKHMFPEDQIQNIGCSSWPGETSAVQRSLKSRDIWKGQNSNIFWSEKILGKLSSSAYHCFAY